MVAATYACAAALLVDVRFEHAADARGGLSGDSWRGSIARLAGAHRVYGRYRAASLVAGDFVAQVFVRGLLITLTVATAFELLDLGESGVGALTAAFGLGGLFGSLGALGLGGGSPLVRVFAAALVGWGLPLVLIGAWPVAALALAALFVSGLSNALLDVSGFTLIQRGVRADDRVTFFGVLEGAFGLALLLGSVTAPLLVDQLGIRGALVATGASLPILAVVTAGPIARNYRTTTGDEGRLTLLRSIPLFAPLPLTALERLCEGAVPVAFQPRDLLMRQGEPGDRYLVLADGTVEILDDTQPLRVCGRGDGIGEIALLRRVPRTATAVATTPVSAYAIDSATFLEAMAGPAARAAAHATLEARVDAASTPVVTTDV
jgi:MFS family permease